MNQPYSLPIKVRLSGNGNCNVSNNLSNEEILVVEKMIKKELKPFQDKVDETFSSIKDQFSIVSQKLACIEIKLGWKNTMLQISGYAFAVAIPLFIFYFGLFGKLKDIALIK